MHRKNETVFPEEITVSKISHLWQIGRQENVSENARIVASAMLKIGQLLEFNRSNDKSKSQPCVISTGTYNTFEILQHKKL